MPYKQLKAFLFPAPVSPVDVHLLQQSLCSVYTCPDYNIQLQLSLSKEVASSDKGCQLSRKQHSGARVSLWDVAWSESTASQGGNKLKS
eukprot:6188211-Pleurochrysis_carterae.AAC.3